MTRLLFPKLSWRRYISYLFGVNQFDDDVNDDDHDDNDDCVNDDDDEGEERHWDLVRAV